MDKSLLVNLHLWGFALVTHAQALAHSTNKVVFPSVNVVHSVNMVWGGGRENCMIFFEKVELFDEGTDKFKKYI